MNLKIDKDNVRMDSYLAVALGISRSKVQSLIKEGKILINEKKVKASDLTVVGDELSINKELEKPIDLIAEDIPLDIVYEDEYLLIVNKPSGLVVHPAAGHFEHTLVNALLYHFPLNSKKTIRPGIVHRIDKDTSGLMVVAKDDKTHELLVEMMKKKEVERTYLAICHGVISHDTGTIDAPIGRDPKNRQKMAVTKENSKNAVTHFKVIKRLNQATLVECRLETGRTHQIRVHFAYIGYPLYNDPLYGNSKKVTSFGQMLHSTKIKFVHPITKQLIEKKVDPPVEFLHLVQELTLKK